MSNEATTLSFDSQLKALRHVERRRLLFELLDANPQTETVVDVEELTREPKGEQWEISMYHVHLPKLEAMGVIEVDGTLSVVKQGPTFDEIEPLLQLLEDHKHELSVNW